MVTLKKLAATGLVVGLGTPMTTRGMRQVETVASLKLAGIGQVRG